MKREFLTGLGLEKEIIDKVLDQHNSEISPLRTQLTTKDTEIETLRSDLISKNSRVAELEKVDVETLQQQLETERVGRAKDKKDFTLKSVLVQNGCKDVDYLLYKLGDSVAFDDNGNLKDADAFIKTTKEAYAAQFAEESAGGTGGTGNFARPPLETKPITKETYAQMTYNEKVQFKNEQPEAYQALHAAE